MKEEKCNKCETILEIGINQSKHRAKKRYHICTPCFNTYFKNRMAYKKDRITGRSYLKLGSFLSRKVTNFIQDSVKKNRELEFSFEEISEMMKKACFYCGDNDIDSGYVGVDRFDSKYGYTKNNSVPCCKICNFAKRDLEAEVFINHCRKVTRYNKEV